jgi:hypothetical protein
MIAQNLNRDFVLGTTEATADAIDGMLANRAAGVGGAPSALDDVSNDDLRALADWLRDAVAHADDGADERPPEQISDAPPPPKDDYVFMPRTPELGLVQAAFEDLARESDELSTTTAPMTDDRRSGPDPVVTDVSLDGIQLQLTAEGRRLFGKFEVAHPKMLSDPRWISSLIEKVKARGRKAPFKDDGPTIALGLRARVILVGDWGSGLPRALHVRDQMAKALSETPDGVERHAIHLGDVYYSGTESEYQERFLTPWMTAAGDGSRSYALNGNHDMYSGGFAYFEKCLTDPRFAAQQGSSYFRLANEHWQLLALDTSYDDKDLHGRQVDWVGGHLGDFGGQSVLLSHHQLFSPYEKTAPAVHDKLAPLLRKHGAAGWFWAHEHRCLVYRDHELIPFASCVGHGGIPEYLVKELDEPPAWLEYEYRKRHSTDWQPWDTFGFAILDLDGEDGTVTYVDEDGDAHYTTKVVAR